ncbi:MAG: hypothetical protein ACOCT9_01245 [archaeon]
MRIKSKEIAKEHLLGVIREVNIFKLLTDAALASNPYSIIHPCYLLYIWGKLEESDDILKKAIAELNNFIQQQIDKHEYNIAGEFCILKLKTEGHIKENPNNFTETYKQCLDLFENLSIIENNPYNLEAILEVKHLARKYGDVNIRQKEIDTLSRKTARKYKKQAEKITERRLRDIKLIKYFQAISYLNKVKENIKEGDQETKRILANRIITVGLRILNEIKDTDEEKISFSEKKHLINLYYQLGKAYRILNKKEQSGIFLGKSIRSLKKILKEPFFEEILFQSKKILHKDDGYYRFLGVRLLSGKVFKQVASLLERIEILNLQTKIVEEFNDLSLDNLKPYREHRDISNQIIDYYQQLIKIFKGELNENPNPTDELLKQKYRALCVFFYYKIYKLLKKKEKTEV